MPRGSNPSGPILFNLLYDALNPKLIDIPYIYPPYKYANIGAEPPVTVTDIVLQADTKNRKVYFKCNYNRSRTPFPDPDGKKKDYIKLIEYSDENSIYFKNLSVLISSLKGKIIVKNEYEYSYESSDGKDHNHHIITIQSSSSQQMLSNKGIIDTNWTY